MTVWGDAFKSPSCSYWLAWRGLCGAPVTSGDRCVDHDLPCENCGARATGDCGQTLGALVCGSPLCDECEHVPNKMTLGHRRRKGS